MTVDELADLVAGDEVVVIWPHTRGTPWTARVARITPTQVVLDTGWRFRRSDGAGIGEYRGSHIERPTAAHRAAMRRRDQIRAAQDAWGRHDREYFAGVDLDALLAVLAPGARVTP